MKNLESNTASIINLTYSLEATQRLERHLKKIDVLTLVPLARRICKAMGHAFKRVTAGSSLLL